MNIEQRWDAAIERAKDLLIKYKELSETSEKYTYSYMIGYLEDYLYLADVWKRQSPAVLELLEKAEYNPELWRDKIPYGPKHGKAGRNVY